jgi:hypothetical protein
MADAMKYMSYQSGEDTSADWAAVMDKTKMGDIMPNGFEYSILYELVMRIAPD